MQLRTAFLVTGVCLCAPMFLIAQPPAGKAPAGRAPYKPKNLQVLPDNTDLRKVMHGFTDSLGVECEFCHTKADPVTKKEDRASDANPMKDTARYMISMTDDLNEKYLKEVPNVKDQDKTTITCGTCHRGQKLPAAFVPPPKPGKPGMAPGAAPAGMAPAVAPPASPGL